MEGAVGLVWFGLVWDCLLLFCFVLFCFGEWVGKVGRVRNSYYGEVIVV